MANTTLTTFSYRNDSAARSIDDIDKQSYYIFNAQHTQAANSNVIDSANSSVSDSIVDIYRNMISGKRITKNDVSLAIRNIPYTQGVVYDMYDDKLSNLSDRDYYVSVNTSSYHHVFKCLDNNQGANSTVAPTFADVSGSNTHLYQTSDGYRWKYMYTYSSAQALKFASSDYIPLIPNNDVMTAAIPGSIDIIKVEDSGKGYHNYLVGTFSTGDLSVNGDSTRYALANSVAKTVNGYYTDCLLYVKSGAGAGQYRTITDYVSTGNGNFVTLDNAFSTSPTNGSQYEIYPQVFISGSGTETINAVGRALVNALASNIIFRVEIMNPGRNYVYATASVAANIAVGVTQTANVRPIISPPDGLGANPLYELSCRNVVVSMTFANSEANTIPSTNFYRKIGLIKNPLFWSVDATINNTTGTFLPGETIITGSTKAVKLAVTTHSGNNVITSNVGDFTETVDTDSEYILRNDLGTSFQYVTVDGVTNSSSITLSQNVFFNAVNATLMLLSNTSTAVANTQTGLNNLLVANATSYFTTGSQIYGTSSGAQANITSTSRGGVAKDYSTFVNLTKYVGSLSFGSFNQNEYVYSGNSKAFLHSFRLDSGVFTAYVSNSIGLINTGSTITGNTSTAIMSVTTKYNPEIVFGSGIPFYIENTIPIPRTDKQSEVFKVILNF